MHLPFCSLRLITGYEISSLQNLKPGSEYIKPFLTQCQKNTLFRRASRILYCQTIQNPRRLSYHAAVTRLLEQSRPLKLYFMNRLRNHLHFRNTKCSFHATTYFQRWTLPKLKLEIHFHHLHRHTQKVARGCFRFQPSLEVIRHVKSQYV